MLSQSYNIIIDHGVSAPVNGREAVDGLNATAKMFLLQLIETYKMPCSKGYYIQMVIHSATHKSDVSLEQ